MLIIGLLFGLAGFLLAKTALDYFYGPNPGYRYIGDIYAELRGEKRENKRMVRKKRKYSPIKMDMKSYIKYAIPAVTGIFIFCLLFLRSIPASVAACLFGFFYPRYIIQNKIRKRKELLNIQLREALYSISNSLKAGNSLQSAVERSVEDTRRVLKTQIDKPMVEELELIVYEIQLGKTLEEALISFRNRTDMEDIDTFVNAAIITREKGGNLTEVMANVSEAISDKIQIRREIMTLTAGKRSEAKLLTFMPIAMVVLLSFSSPAYMKPMYETLLGKSLMIVGLILLAANYIIGKRIIDIKV